MSFDTLFATDGLLDTSNVSFWILVGIGLCLIIVIVLLVRILQNRKVQFTPLGRVSSPHLIRLMLQEAFDQRRDFEIQISSISTDNRPTLKCTPQYMGRNNFTLEAVGLKHLSDHWIGREITVFFRITTKGVFSYHTFNSTIQSIHNPRKDVCHLTLPLPDNVDNRQQRSFLRIEPPTEFLYGGAIWYGDTMPDPSQLNDLSLWPRPVLFLLPSYAVQFRISDLSAGGIRLHITNNIVKKLNLKLSTVDRFIVMLDLLDPEEMKVSRFWLQCRTQRIMMEPPERDVHLGAKFLAWGKPREPYSPESPGSLEWFRLSPSHEVEPVGNWIMRRHLALFRSLSEDAEKGVE